MGRCSRWGIVAFAFPRSNQGRTDRARTVRDAAILMLRWLGPRSKDTTSVDRAVPDYEARDWKIRKTGDEDRIPKEYASTACN